VTKPADPIKEPDMPTESPRFSFFDPEYRRNPYPVLARLRAQAPVYKTDYCWVVTRHADVTMLNRDPRCGRDTRKLKSGGFAARMADYPGMVELVTNAMVHLDPPDHTRIRKLIAHAFSPKAVEQMERSVTEVARRLCDELPEQGDFDLMRRLAKPLPVTVICDLMQVPRDDYPLFERWSDAITEHLEVTSSPEQIAAADRAYLEFKAWMAGFVEERRREPGTGLVDRLIAAEAVEGALSSDELLCNIIILLIGGHETTTNLIGNGLLALLEHPDQLALLRARPELIGSAIEECLRYESPLNLNGRCPHEDIEVSGQVIKKGQLIMCMLGAANRDPEVFAEPDRLDITRSPNPHQSFGGGPHFCVGAPLARLEGRIALTALLDRYPTIALDRGRVRWKDRINFRGLAELGLAVSR
jgi:cytochrome P450